MSEPPRRRVAIPSESRESSERRSFFRIAAILGVLVGIPVGVFGLPALLNLFFDEPTIPPGGAWSEDGLTIWVESYYPGAEPSREAFVTLALRTPRGWTFEAEGVELELTQGDAVPLDRVTTPEGEGGRLRLWFVLADADEDAELEALRLSDPRVRFELVESDH